MKSEIKNVQQFITSLSPKQRVFFLGRESETQSRLEAGLRDLGRSVSQVSALNGEALAIVLTAKQQPVNRLDD